MDPGQLNSRRQNVSISHDRSNELARRIFAVLKASLFRTLAGKRHALMREPLPIVRANGRIAPAETSAKAMLACLSVAWPSAGQDGIPSIKQRRLLRGW